MICHNCIQRYAKLPAPFTSTIIATLQHLSVTKPRKTLIGENRLIWCRKRELLRDGYGMRQIISATCGLWLCLAGAALAQSEPVVVVELYTSQGCSSCPPADDFLAMLAMDPSIMPLALHVDYWDYIGWADKFANPKFTDRQKAYAHQAGTRSIYTPQMIVGGLDRVEGYKREETGDAIRKHLKVAQDIGLTLNRKGNTLTIRANATATLGGDTIIQLVRYIPSETVDIERGENAGKSITYYNIVTSWQKLGDWSGAAALNMQASVKGDDPVVVIVQQEGPSYIVAAARID